MENGVGEINEAFCLKVVKDCLTIELGGGKLRITTNRRVLKVGLGIEPGHIEISIASRVEIFEEGPAGKLRTAKISSFLHPGFHKNRDPVKGGGHFEPLKARTAKTCIALKR